MKRKSVIYKIKKNQMKTLYRNNIFQNQIVSNLLVSSFILCDFFVILVSINDKISGNQLMNILMAFVYACILDISLYLVGKDIDCLSDCKKFYNIMLIVVFFLFLIGFCFLRFQTASDLFQGQMENSTYKMNSIDYAIVSIMCIIPLGTSALSFRIGYISSDERKSNYQKQLQLDCIYIKERIQYLELCNKELELSIDIDLKKYDKQLYDNALSKVKTEENNLKLDTRKLIAGKINTADAVTILLQQYKNKGE